MRNKLTYLSNIVIISLAVTTGLPANATECIAPSNPGGGWDFTCRTVGRILSDLNLVDGNVQVTNIPGGTGAVGFARVASKRSGDPDLLVATSTVAITKFAQGLYPGTMDDARFVAMLGTDVGVIAVPADSPYYSLNDLTAVLKEDPNKVVGTGDGAGSWDHIRYLEIAKEGGIKNLRGLRWVQFDGGSEAITQMLGGKIDVVTTDLGEASGFLKSGDIRLLAVLSNDPVPLFPKIHTAISQGYNVTGYNWRGFYVGKNVSDKDYNAWVKKLKTVYDSLEWKNAVKQSGLIPAWRSGEDFNSYLVKQRKSIEDISRSIGVIQ
ncbi:Bug family tripartite tricarboxylate transporter substrate binding protein [Vibrio sp. Vb339]|uniref:Bug family tripartite tricarboxylate transporter substrate binding protein n=1 Tax=Vibrio sp. Vb339 TaxID=1192013 RepID=UPI0015534608|nr:tripartite tricarboxylate transporter substrate-binding protein [Vibrio sp. Vb339]